METRKRSLMTVVFWTLLGLTCMGLVGFALTKAATTGVSVAVITRVLGFLMYLVYLRVWAKIAGGNHV